MSGKIQPKQRIPELKHSPVVMWSIIAKLKQKNKTK